MQAKDIMWPINGMYAVSPDCDNCGEPFNPEENPKRRVKGLEAYSLCIPCINSYEEVKYPLFFAKVFIWVVFLMIGYIAIAGP